MRISDWSSDVCSSDLLLNFLATQQLRAIAVHKVIQVGGNDGAGIDHGVAGDLRSEEHTSELQSLMRISYAVFCLKKKQQTKTYPYSPSKFLFTKTYLPQYCHTSIN